MFPRSEGAIEARALASAAQIICWYPVAETWVASPVVGEISMAIAGDLRLFKGRKEALNAWVGNFVLCIAPTSCV